MRLRLALAVLSVMVSATMVWADGNATLACRTYATLLSGVRDGVLSRAEMREEIKQIHERARWSEVPAIRTRSTGLLRAVTQGDAREFSAAMIGFGEACLALPQ